MHQAVSGWSQMHQIPPPPSNTVDQAVCISALLCLHWHWAAVGHAHMCAFRSKEGNLLSGAMTWRMLVHLLRGGARWSHLLLGTLGHPVCFLTLLIAACSKKTFKIMHNIILLIPTHGRWGQEIRSSESLLAA